MRRHRDPVLDTLYNTGNVSRMAETMTVDDALRRIAALKGQLGEQRRRGEASVSWTGTPDGAEDKPAFDLKACIEKANGVRQELVTLQAAVHVANSVAKIDHNGRMITVGEAVRWCEEYKSEIKWLKGLDSQAQQKTGREEFGYDDEGKRVRVVKMHYCALPQAERAAAVDAVQEKLDRLNLLINKSNRKTEVTV